MLLDAAASSAASSLSSSKLRNILTITRELGPVTISSEPRSSSPKPTATMLPNTTTLESQNDNPSTPNTTTTTTTHNQHHLGHANLDKRPMEELIKLVKSEQFDPSLLSNEEIIDLMLSRQVSVYRLESILGKANASRCVDIRRQYYIRQLELLDKLQTNHDANNNDGNQSSELDRDDKEQSAQETREGKLYFHNLLQSKMNVLKMPKESEFDYTRVVGACCENVIGCVRLPVGLGELLLDGQKVFVPLATTEGCLVASTFRGLSALSKSGGVISRVRKDCMTRAPIVRFADPQLRDALNNVNRAIEWLKDPINKERIKKAFRSTSQHTVLVDYTIHPIGREIHIRFEAQTGDAMGMNMCSKGAEMAIREMHKAFPTMDILTVSGNMCTDKKPSAINMVLGRGKSVECSATLPEEVIKKVFKVSIDKIHEVWLKKTMIGSAMAGSIGGFNSHAANIVAAIFIATGQDAAQVVSSSNCILTMDKDPRGNLEVHCKMPSIECGTVGGGTVLKDQGTYLELMGIKGPTDSQANPELYESNACKLARIICGTVMAAELSLLASLTEGTLVKSHMTLNRSAQPCNVV